MLHADTAKNRLIGIALISATYVCFTLLDGSAKWLVRSLPVIEIVWLRFVTHACLVAAITLPVYGPAALTTRRPRLQALRTLMLVTMTALNFTALQYLQLAVTSSIFFSVPILVAALGAPLLGERLDARRWAAILGGFAGVLVIVQPFGHAFHWAMVISMATALLSALFNLLTRHLAAHDPPEVTNLLTAAGSALVLTPFAIAAWHTPGSALEWVLLFLVGCFGALGHHLLALAYRYAPATVLGPFVYQQVIYMALLGYLVFGDVPGPQVLVGAAIVVASGLFLLLYERMWRAAPQP